MRTAILCSPGSWYYRDLKRAAKSPDQVTAVSFDQLTGGIDDSARLWVRAGSQLLTDYDALVVRSMPPGSLEQVIFRMDALASVECSGCLVVNPPKSLEVAIDKYLALARLAQAGLSVPSTIACQSADEAMAAFDTLGRDVVVKPLFGGEGRGIARVCDPALASRAFGMLESFGAVIYVQPFIDHGGYDTRVLVIGETLLGMRRYGRNDWRTNVSQGAWAEATILDDRQRESAVRAAQAVGAPLAGVDLLQDASGQTYVLEVNAVPGWKALARVLDVDVAGLIWRWLEEERERRTEMVGP
jgi:ribosomal protein S6--L-glutamate ligase